MRPQPRPQQPLAKETAAQQTPPPGAAGPQAPRAKSAPPTIELLPEDIVTAAQKAGDNGEARRTPRPRKEQRRQEPALERHHLPAGPPRPRAALNEKSKAPSIGGLIYALEAKPSNTPYKIAAIASAVWFFVGGLLGWLIVGRSIEPISGFTDLLASPSFFVVIACILVPIALFWFIAQLVWRSQEMKLVASAMTEVAIRLAEPDKMAEQKVASVGQTIRRQVSAMDDAISRALGRAGELEALVHNEVAALERSYSQNEYIIRNLLQELISEREAIAQNSLHVKQTLQGVGAEVSKNIRHATDSIGDHLAQHGTRSAIKLQQAGDHVTKALVSTTQQTIAVKQKIAAELPQLLERMNAEQQKLGSVIEHAGRNLGALDTNIAQKTQALDGSLAKHTQNLDTTLAGHAKAMDTTLAAHAKSLDSTFAGHNKTIDTTLGSHTETLNTTLAGHTKTIDSTIAGHAETIDSRLASRTTDLDQNLARRAGDVEEMMLRHAGDINKRLVQKVKALDASLAMRAKAMDTTLAEKAKELDRTFLAHREQIDTTMQDKAKQLDSSIARQARAMDASLTEKARAIDTALSQRLNDIESRPVSADKTEKAASDLSMLRGSEALARAMQHQTDKLDQALDQNRQELDTTIERQNALSPEISALTEKHNKLVREHAELTAQLREEFAGQGQDLLATARLLSGPDMKMNQMMGPQQNKARAVLADILGRADKLEKSRRAFALSLDNSLMVAEETADRLRRHLAANASPRAEMLVAEVDRITGETRLITDETKREMKEDAISFAQQVVEAVSSMSRSSNRTRVLPGEVAVVSTDIHKAVDEQLRALDALAQISGTALGANRVTASGGVQVGSQAGGPGAGGTRVSAAGGKPSAAPRGQRQPSQWSFGDLLARVADTDMEADEPPLPNYRPATAGSGSRNGSLGLNSADNLRMDDIGRALDSHTAALAWNRYQAGERNVFNRRLYSPEGQKTFDQVAERYAKDAEFRMTVEKYIADFEGLLGEAEEKDPSGRVIQNYLTSETGRVYLVLAHASGRLG